MSCLLCERVKLAAQGKWPALVHEFPHSYLFLGEHQYYRGYCVLVTKQHFREMSDIPAVVRNEFFHEMMLTHELLERTFQPKKMNMCSLGNVVDHIHWHFFPRYAQDENFNNPPWLQMQHFESAKLTPAEQEKLILLLQNQLQPM